MAHITGGEVSFGRTINTGDYESKRADVKLTFKVDEGEDDRAVLDATMQLAHGKCHELLGLKSASPRQAAANEATRTITPAAEIKPAAGVTVETAGPAEAAAKGRTRKAPPVVEAKADPAGIEGLEETKPVTETKPATQSDEELFAAAVETKPAEKPASDDELFAATAPEVTDEALMSAITKKNVEIRDPIAIRALIGCYVEAPKQAREIPQDKRGAFIKELEALKPKAAAAAA